ncbi:SMP-30/gluconolactonase/LRE family protein [Bacillus dakarensis]|uniref:SMP-30/gluconolactonase/LRE family protein n=1 Tax=Robertmurraya dakarensis TaxID=1926278 RepID=UPI0009822477|nr:SMP-30/gluconolactonase/LRE family protein [Bacillus dakarensis]
MESSKRNILLTGLGYLEAARWYDGALWFSDIKNKTVNRVSPTGEHTIVTTVEARPSGLGFEQDGTPQIVSMEDSRLLRLKDGRQEMLVDFGGDSLFINDMVVDSSGRAYISQFGYDLFGGESPKQTRLLIRHPDGRVEQSGEGLTFPNGIGITPDGRTLIVAESFGVPCTKLTAFDIRTDGSLCNQRVFAEFDTAEKVVPDGICIDSEGAVWVGICRRGEFWRVLEGGEVTDVISIPPEGGNYCVDCALGGEDMQTLFMLIADTNVERLGNNWDSSARIETVRVSVPGFVRPAVRS